MKICLVMPLSVSDFVDIDDTLGAQPKATGPHLGILTLAAVLRRHGWTPSVLNLNELFVDFMVKSRGNASVPRQDSPLIRRVTSSGRPVGEGTFLDFVCAQLSDMKFDVLGIGSICSSYPLSLRIAERLKRLHPDVPVILGGPQASVVDVQTLEAFAPVDYVLRGEADASLPQLLSILSGENAAALDSVAGLTYRHGGTVRKTGPAPLVELDDLPLPAFDLDPYAADRGSLALELGRGCPFACTFCSTNDFFRRSFRVKSTAKLLGEMTYLKETYDISKFDLVHDMYTVNRRKVVEFCEALLLGGHEFEWGCSARTDCVDDRLIALMADAGCKGMFFGIESGSMRMQRVINKKLDLVEATARIATNDANGIRTAVALIIGFPDETRDDLRDSIHYLINARRFDCGEPQMSLLAPLAETPIEVEFRDQLEFDDIVSEMSHQGWQWNEGDIEDIKKYPRIFPNFYAVPTKWATREYLSKLHGFTNSALRYFRWLVIGLVQDSGDFLSVFDRWLALNPVEPPAGDDRTYLPYYARIEFQKDFLDFIERVYLPEAARNKAAIRGLVANERAILEVMESACAEAKQCPDAFLSPGGSRPEISLELTHSSVPKQAKHMRITTLGVDYEDLLARLRSGAGLSEIPEREVTLAYHVTEGGEVEIRRLSRLSAALLGICGEGRPVRQLIAAPEWQECLDEGMSPERAALVGLKQLREQSLLVV